MAAFCGKCGAPFGDAVKFCPSCGTAKEIGAPLSAAAPPQQTGTPAVQTVPAKSGMSALKVLAVVLVLGFGVFVLAAVAAVYVGKSKFDAWRQTSSVAQAAFPGPTAGATSGSHTRSSRNIDPSIFLTKEEVGAIIGVPVTSIEMEGAADAQYKTEVMGMEASIEIEREDGEAGAAQSLEAARKVTQGVFGGKGAPVAAVGDDAVYGAFNVLYVRKNDVFLTITPPNLQQAAQMKQYNEVTSQPMGSDAQVKSMKKFSEMMKGDPATGSLAKPDAVSGAADLIQHAATEHGDEYETRSRSMARAMAEKVLAKL